MLSLNFSHFSRFSQLRRSLFVRSHFVSLSCSLTITSRKIQAKRNSPSVAATVMMEFEASLFRLPLPGMLDFGFRV
jgi:hypothetical protein